MFVYIKRNVKSMYVVLDEQLDAEQYTNVGTTYQDFLDNLWVLLSDEQIKFHEENPNASVKEVFNMKLDEPIVFERTLEDAKRDKIFEIDKYDNSSEVNSFTINNVLSAWFTPEERANYKNSVDSAKILGIKELSLFIGDKLVTVSVEEAEIMLASIQLYADACFMVTKNHKFKVEDLESIEEVDSYDFTVGYPQKLNFNTND